MHLQPCHRSAGPPVTGFHMTGDPVDNPNTNRSNVRQVDNTSQLNICIKMTDGHYKLPIRSIKSSPRLKDTSSILNVYVITRSTVSKSTGPMDNSLPCTIDIRLDSLSQSRVRLTVNGSVVNAKTNYTHHNHN